MTGLEKIITRILEEAESEAAKITSAAEDKGKSILKDYADKAEIECQRINSDSVEKCEGIISRAKSSAAIAKRNELLRVQGETVDKAFDMAMKEIINYPREKYCDMLIMLLTDALTSYIDTSRKNYELYGESDDVEKYEVLLNRKDYDAYSGELIEGLRKRVIGRIDSSELDKVVVSNETVNINGGLILRCGNIECNSSLSKLFAANRPLIEGKISKIISGSKA